VVITPDGFAQGKYAGSYSLILNKRKGFIRLAQETGALLVPVLGIGEHKTVPGGPYTPNVAGFYAWLVPKALTVTRTHPVKVVFGKPLQVTRGESVEKTHQKYVEALLALGKEHGVELRVVE
jgi:hypothetical protein